MSAVINIPLISVFVIQLMVLGERPRGDRNDKGILGRYSNKTNVFIK